MTILTEADKTEIRRRYHNDPKTSYRKLAKEFKCAPATIEEVITKKREKKRKEKQAEASKGKKPGSQTISDSKAQTPARDSREARMVRLKDGALREAETVKDELIVHYREQRAGLEELLVEWDNAKSVMKDLPGLRDDVTFKLFGRGVPGKEEMLIEPVYKYSALSEEQKAQVDRMLPEYAFGKLHKFFMMVQEATEQLKLTLAQLTHQEKVMVQYFGDVQINIFDKEGYTRLLFNEVFMPVLKEELPTAVAGPLTKKMTQRYEKKLALLEKYGEEDDKD